MTLAEQLKQYQDEWVLIEYTELDEHLNVIQGRVIARSPNKDTRSIVYWSRLKART